MNYIIFDDNFERGKIVLSDLEKLKNVKINFHNRISISKIISFLFRLHLAQRLNNKINMPFKKIWYNRLTSNNFNKDEEICFIFISARYLKEFSQWIKIKFPNSKQVLVFPDTFELFATVIPDLITDNLLSVFDLVLTSNPSDAKKHGFVYTPMFISRVDEAKIPKCRESDVAFIGVAKDRLPILHSLFVKLESFNLNCNFYITMADKKNQKYSNKIQYSKKEMNYLEYLGEELSSKCLIEIIKGSTKGNTYRSWEAVYYNKKLITNWEGIKSFKFYDPRYMLYIESVDDIKEAFFQENINVEYSYNNENSPIHLLELINKHLST